MAYCSRIYSIVSLQLIGHECLNLIWEKKIWRDFLFIGLNISLAQHFLHITKPSRFFCSLSTHSLQKKLEQVLHSTIGILGMQWHMVQQKRLSRSLPATTYSFYFWSIFKTCLGRSFRRCSRSAESCKKPSTSGNTLANSHFSRLPLITVSSPWHCSYWSPPSLMTSLLLLSCLFFI